MKNFIIYIKYHAHADGNSKVSDKLSMYVLSY